VYAGLCPLAFTPDGRRLLSWGDDRQFCLWDAATGKEVWRHKTRLSDAPVTPGRPEEFPSLHESVGDVRFTPDGRLAAVAVAGNVYVIESLTGREVVKLPGQIGPIHLGFSPDGRSLAVAGWDQVAQVWEVASGKALMRAEKVGHVNSVAVSPDGRFVALGSEFTDGVIYVLDAGTGKAVQELRGHGSYVGALAFGPDGRSLASGQRDTTALVWDLAPARNRPAAAAGNPEALWAALAGDDAAKARDAAVSLAATPGAVAFLTARLRPAERVTPERLRQLIADLDSPRYATREAAGRELAAVWREAEPVLRESLKGGLSLEVRKRIEAMLASPPPVGVATGEALRRVRAVAVLEAVGSPEARALLAALAAGAPSARDTVEAKAACERAR
jgi:WD40 repeat protein